jgi:hypothetical protein
MSHPNSFPRTLFFYCIGVLSIVIILCIVFLDYGYDDPYITFRYSWNLMQGNGFVFNVGEPVLSTTAPGYALLLAATGLIYPDIPLLGNVLSAVGLGLGAISLYLWASETGQPFVGWIAGVFLLTFPLPITTFGSEVCFYIGMLLLGLYLYTRQRFDLAMGVMAVVTLIRPDGVIAAGLVMLHVMWTQRRVLWRPVLIYLLVLLPWLVYATWAFGSPIPVTLSAKQAQGRMLISDSFVWRAWKVFVAYMRRPLYRLYVPLGLVGIWRVLVCKRRWWILLAWTVCYFVGYAVLRVSGYFWYYAPLVPAAVLSVAVGLDWVRSKLANWRLGRFWQWGAMALCLVCLCWPNVQGLHYASRHPDKRLAIYRHAGRWIDANLPADASVSMLEVGIVGYYARRRIIGFAALLQPEATRLVNEKTTYGDIAQWAIRVYEPDYVLWREGSFPPGDGWIVYHVFERTEEGVGPLILYRVNE